MTVPVPTVLFDEEAVSALIRGFDRMAEALACTLGPLRGSVLLSSDTRRPELLVDAATTARRIIEFPDRAEDVGAMMMRNLAWRVHTRTGDGVATAATIAQVLLREATRYVRAGGNPMLVRRGIEKALAWALADLASEAQRVSGEDALTAVALAVTGEERLSLVLGEMLDVLGADAHITLEDYAAPYLERAYFEGGRWPARLESPYLMTDPAGRRAVQEECRVVLYFGILDRADDIVPFLERLDGKDRRPVLLVAKRVQGEALNALVTNHHRGRLKVVACATTRYSDAVANDLADLGLLTGATVLGGEIGRGLEDLVSGDIGYARRVEANPDALLVTGGGGDPAVRRRRVDDLRVYLGSLAPDAAERPEVQLRLARMAGGVGVLKVGAYTEAQRSATRQKAEKAIRSLRAALSDGVVPGGGAAYLRVSDSVRRHASRLSDDERQGALALAAALEAPFRRIVRNSGGEPAAALAALGRARGQAVFDVTLGRVVMAAQAGIYDPAGVLRTALEAATSGATVAMTVAAMVLHRKPERAAGP